MNFKQKLGYMVIGCVFTLAGYFLATLCTEGFNSQNASAQENTKQVIDEIICRKLKIVNDQGNTVVSLEPVVNGGSLSIYNDAGKDVVSAGTLFDCHGSLAIYDKEGIPVSDMSADNTGGSIAILKIIDEGVREIAAMYADEDGGHVRIRNKSAKVVAALGAIDEHGRFVIGNKSGKTVAGLGVEDDAGILSIANKNEIEVATLKGFLGSGSLSLSNKEGMTRAVLAASPSSYLPSTYMEREREGEDGATLSSRAYGYADSGFLSISNKNGDEVATLGATSDGGLLSIYNKNWKVSARVGVDIYGWGGFQSFRGKWRTH